MDPKKLPGPTSPDEPMEIEIPVGKRSITLRVPAKDAPAFATGLTVGALILMAFEDKPRKKRRRR